MALCCILAEFGPLALGIIAVAAICFVIQKFILPGSGNGPRVLKDLRGLHVFITGGSKGIGRALAVEAVRQGASVVTIVARDRRQLDDASLELTQLTDSLADSTGHLQRIQTISLDLTSDYSSIEAAITGAEETAKQPIDVLINNAGGSVDGEFDQLPIETFDKQMRLNYISAVHTTRAVVKSMKSRPSDHCRIVFVSSQASQVAIYGYTAYAPTKYALRGFAEALRMELKPYNIWITITFPPNTRTEGFTEELLHMPEPTRRISGDTDDTVMEASKVAVLTWKDVRHGRYQSTMGMDGWMLGILTAGMTPIQNGSVFDMLQQVALVGLFRFIALFYVNKFDGIVAQCRNEENQKVTRREAKKVD